jgi:hypothetical protein
MDVINRTMNQCKKIGVDKNGSRAVVFQLGLPLHTTLTDLGKLTFIKHVISH